MPSPRLSPLDSSFLAVETPTAHMHVGWAATLDPPADEQRPSFRELRDHIQSRLTLAPRYRQKLEPVPLGVNSPVWTDDVDFDIGRHVVRARSTSLRGIVEDCVSRPLDRNLPLWQICIAERLEDERIGLVGKLHHCMVDGIAAVELGRLLLDPEPQCPASEPDSWEPRPPPAEASLLTQGVIDRVRDQLELATAPARIASSPKRVFDFTERARQAALALADSFRPANPVQALNPPISPRRHLGMLGRPLGELRRIRSAFGTTINDVVLAVATGAMRRFMKGRGQDPQRLKAMVPVDVRGQGEGAGLGNRISFMFVDLPCDEPDPVHRLRSLHMETSERKEAGTPEGADAVLQAIGYAPQTVREAVSRLVATPRAFNLTVSNIPGPREPLYMRGCRLAEAYPVVPLADRHALSIGFTTVCDGGFFGLYADRESLPDIDTLTADVAASIDELLELCGDATRREEAIAAVELG